MRAFDSILRNFQVDVLIGIDLFGGLDRGPAGLPGAAAEPPAGCGCVTADCSKIFILMDPYGCIYYRSASFDQILIGDLILYRNCEQYLSLSSI